jgi:hypothetical protein
VLAHLGAPNQLFHTPAGTAFADIPVKDHQETWPIRSKRFRSWLRRGYYEATGEAGSAAAVRSPLDLLEARAQFDAQSARSTSGPPSTPDASILISPTSTGVRSKSDRMVGR